MIRKCHLLVGLVVVFGAAFVLAGLFGQPLFSAVEAAVVGLLPGQKAGPDNLYTYTIETKRSGEVYVLVNVDFRNVTTRVRYLQANQEKAEAMILKGGPPVQATVAFAKPIPIADFEALVKSTGFVADNYVLEIRDQQGKPAWNGGRAKSSNDGTVVDLELARPGLEKLQASIDGAVILVGSVPPTKDGLGRLLKDPRVFLADVVATEVLERVSRDTGAAREKIRVDVLPAYSFIRGGTQ